MHVSSYSSFAEVYDFLMTDISYEKWADFIEDIFIRQGLKPNLVCELGCGTGNITAIMARRGYSIIAVDKSNEMLCCARKKINSGVLFLQQDIRRFELYGTVDAIICTCDSLNYILKERYIFQIFKLVKNYLNPNGVFIFDINTEYHFKKVLAKNVFFSTSKKVSYIWKNFYDTKKRINEYDIDFFVKLKDGNYKRFNENHFERAHKIKTLTRLSQMAGLSLVGIYDDYTHKKYKKNSRRICFVLKNKGDKKCKAIT